jgi:hypothetical protein
MKILKIKKESFEGVNDSLEITLEGYENTKPIFPKDITAEELKTKLAEWKIKQDEVNNINADRTPRDPETTEQDNDELPEQLKSLEGTEV